MVAAELQLRLTRRGAVLHQGRRQFLGMANRLVEHEPLLSVAEGGVPGGEEIGGVRRTASWRARTTD